MPDQYSGGRAVGSTIRGVKVTAHGGKQAGQWVARNVTHLRVRGGAGEIGMIRLLDLHALSCAGDTLVTMGLAGTVFLNVSPGEARGRVALYLLITMAPFALLAPVIGPLLDRFRHGRRYALALTMLGRALLAWIISDNLKGFGLYPAAFGVLALSRAYGVARSAAVPRLLPAGLGLSEAGARASIFGTVAGAVVAPIGLLANMIGQPWPLRVAALIFILGMIVAVGLPPRADSEPPEKLPRIFLLPNRESVKVLSGRLVVTVLVNGVVLRALYGFLVLFLAFSIRSKALTTSLFGIHLSPGAALAFAIGALGVGTFLATAVGARMAIRRPAFLQAVGMAAVALVALVALIGDNLALVTLLSLVTAIAAGLAKLAVDATIQERIDEDVRASAFAHSETVLMLAFVAGGAIGLIPFPGQVGIGIAAGGMILAACRSGLVAFRQRGDHLVGVAHSGEPADATLPDSDTGPVRDDERIYLPAAGTPGASPVSAPPSGGPRSGQSRASDPAPGRASRLAAGSGGGPTVPVRHPAASQPAGALAPTKVEPGPAARASATPRPAPPKPSRWRRLFGTDERTVAVPAPTPAPTRILPREEDRPAPRTDVHTPPRGEDDQPGYHIYHPSPKDGRDV